MNFTLICLSITFFLYWNIASAVNTHCTMDPAHQVASVSVVMMLHCTKNWVLILKISCSIQLYICLSSELFSCRLISVSSMYSKCKKTPWVSFPPHQEFAPTWRKSICLPYFLSPAAYVWKMPLFILEFQSGIDVLNGARIAQSVVCWARCPAWCSIAGSNFLWASGRGDFSLEVQMVSDSIPPKVF